MYQRIGQSAFKKDLTNITKLCEALGDPQKEFKSIHIAGTNGKGSTSHILSAIYQNNGYKVGLYTSPHLVDFRERIKIDGQMCPQDYVVGFTKEIAPLIEEIQPSFFEITVAMAFTYFAIQKVDVAIIETGLGGRLDSTNIITPITSIITSIGFDHKDMLGDTLELIAAEKAGIIKPNVPVVLGNISKEPKEVITKTAQRLEAPVSDFYDGTFRSDLKGKHQQWNIGTALKTLEILHSQLPVEMDLVNYALQNVCSISNFEGRWQTISKSPLVICDVAHNEEGLKLIASQLKQLNKKIHYVLGFVSDKDLASIIPLLPKAESINLVKPNVPRGMNANKAKEAFLNGRIEAKACGNLQEALKDSYSKIEESNEEENSVLFVGGSNFVIADLLHLKAEGNLPWTS